MKRTIALWGMLLCLLTPALAMAGIPDAPVDAETYVFDYAAILSEEDTRSMDAYADALNGATSAMPVCVVMDSLDGADVRDYAFDLFNAWGIGDKDRNDGLLLLVSTGDGVIYLATGTGMEDILTDADAGQLLDEYAMPHLREGAYAAGIRSVFEAMCRQVAEAQGKELTAMPEGQ